MAVVGAVGLAASLAQTLLTGLQSQELKEMCSMFSCEPQLEKLEKTMSTISALLLDVDEKRQGLTHEGRNWIEKLKDAVYDVDDLLDEFRTIGHLRKQTKDALFSKKVGNFFSRHNKFFVNFNVSREIQMLNEKLNDIAKDHKKFGFMDVFVNKPAVVREETCSVTSEIEVIGREEEKETIVSMLLSEGSPSDRNVSFVNIVGVGGLGKTTLSQLVYNDERVKAAFEKRIWVCVSEQFSLKDILCKILGNEVFNLQVASEQVQSLLKGKRYLLVLDDVWEDELAAWSKLKGHLVSDVSGSKVIVTTRSWKVASATGKDSIKHGLQHLSEENSWRLFELIAFGKQREDHQVDPDLFNIGRDVVKKCAKVPLSIKVVASLLHGQSKNKWEMFRSVDLAEMSDEDDENSIIMSTLMFSYYQLTPKLKSCFSFCSIFPKDHRIKKELLINMWLAHGYLVAPNKGKESLEEVGEAYLTILLNRCFFQDINLDKHGDVYSFKMHDLMHDLAVKVAGNESLIITPATKNQLEEKTRHLSREWGTNLCTSDKLRSYVWLDDVYFFKGYAQDSDEVTPIVSNCKRLRVLSLPKFSIRCSLPEKVGKLLHLRYLALTDNRLEMLPKSITKLHNLQTLILGRCRDLKELPDDIGKLVNMRTLEINHCKNLNELPEDISKLVNLRTLDISHCENLKELPDNIGKLVNLRKLDISGCRKLKKLPDDIGKLVNLRTLDISGCEKLKELPNDIGKLVNLWTLDASGCKVLKELPEDMIKLVNLRALNISYCHNLTYMPRGMCNLTNLERLSDFILSGVDVKQKEGSKLEDLKAPLRSLKGDLRIRILNFSSYNMPHATKRAFTLKNASLESLSIKCDDNEIDVDQREVHETLVEDLCPNEDICEISMYRYKGMKMPSWAALLMKYSDTNEVQHVTSLSRFCCLKILHLDDLPNVEYIMEIENDGAWESSCTLFFPVLEKLVLSKMPKLKGWWRGLRWREMKGVAGGGCLVDDNGLEHALPLPCFPRLRDLRIDGCKSMTYFPPCPQVKDVFLVRVNKAMTFCMKGGASSSSLSTSSSSSCMERLIIDNARVTNRVLLSEFAEGGVSHITLSGDGEVKSMGTLREGFERVGFRLKKLEIYRCHELDIEEEEEEGMPWKYLQSLSSLTLWKLPKMVKLPKGLCHLTSLQSLHILYCDNMEEVGECIGSLTSLQSLEFYDCNKLKGLPECIGSLTSLESILIRSKQLESIPESMCHLTSLTTLDIFGANDKLQERCRQPNGEYWPRICHIPRLDIRG